MARFITICSGSSGNASLVEEDGRFLLIDIGLSCRAALRAIETLGLAAEGLAGLLITHEHSDHIKGLTVFTKRTGTPVFASEATLEALWEAGQFPPGATLHTVDGSRQSAGPFTLEGFAINHDAAGPLGYRITTASGACMAISTDLGEMSEDVFLRLQGASLVALEANYDPHMLRTGPYPPVLQRRISSRKGHLSNHDSAAVVAALVAGGCRRVSLCHLSEENNHPDCVRTALDEAFSASGRACPPECVIQIAPRYSPGRWMDF